MLTMNANQAQREGSAIMKLLTSMHISFMIEAGYRCLSS